MDNIFNTHFRCKFNGFDDVGVTTAHTLVSVSVDV